MSYFYKYYKRRFLNKREGRAYSICSLHVPKRAKKKEDWQDTHFQADVELGDCSRNITLDFGWDAFVKGDFEKSKKKLEELITSLKNLSSKMDEYHKNWKPYGKGKNLLHPD